MAMLRLLARKAIGVALVPPVMVRDELRDGRLREICRVPGLTKRFYAVTLSRQFPNPLVNKLIESAEDGPRAPKQPAPKKA